MHRKKLTLSRSHAYRGHAARQRRRIDPRGSARVMPTGVCTPPWRTLRARLLRVLLLRRGSRRTRYCAWRRLAALLRFELRTMGRSHRILPTERTVSPSVRLRDGGPGKYAYRTRARGSN
jgi:hypothetical protein